MNQSFVIAIDQSTQGTKLMLFNQKGALVARQDMPHRQIVDSEGHVSHDLGEIRLNLFEGARLLLEKSGVDKSSIKATGICNQRESVGIWNRKTGEPLAHSVVWQCNRATSIAEKVKADGYEDYVHETCGLPLSPFFSAPKIKWLLDNTDCARSMAEAGELCVGTMDCWVIFCLTNGTIHKTDISNASRMMLLNLKTGSWDPKLCQVFDIPMNILPEICDSDSIFGFTDFGGLLSKKVPIRAAIGDSNGALLAQCCIDRGSCMTGFGTGSCVIMNIGDKPILSRKGLISSVGWRIGGKTTFVFDGVINYSGAVITWLCKDLGLASSPRETEKMAFSANPEDNTFLIPAFTGIGAPHWYNKNNGVLWGMSRTTGKNEIVKASLESIALQVSDIVRAMAEDASVVVKEMKVSGGPTKNAYLMQFQSDILGCPIFIPSNEEMSCLSAALIAGMACGITTMEDVISASSYSRFEPKMDKEERLRKMNGWETALKAALA